MERYDLPDGWEWMKLPDVADIIMGQSPPGSTYNKSGNGLPFYQGKADFGNPYPTPRVYCTKPKKVAQPGDILMSVRAPVGPTNLVNQECAIGRGLSIIRPKDGMPANYLRAYFTLIEPFIAELGTGSTFTSISKSDLEGLDIPVSPIPEQQRIVAKIESLFEQSRTARTALTRIPTLMSQFRRAVLASAMSGHLTEDWREERNLSIVDWDAKTGNEIFQFITSGSRWWAKYYSDSGSIFIRVGNLDHDTIELDLSNIQYVTPPDDAEGKRTRVQVGDILISITADVGMVGYVRKDIGDAYINQHICLARPTGEHLGEYLAYYLASPVGGFGQLTKAQRGATKAGLTLGDIRELHFQIPAIEEQTEIVSRVEKLFAQADIIEQAASVSLRRAEQVDQSILARAFRGELE